MQTLTVGRSGESGHREPVATAGRTSVLDTVRRQDFNRIDQADVAQRLGKTPCAPSAAKPVGGPEEPVPVSSRQGINSVDERREVCREFECLVHANPEPPEVLAI